MGGLTGGSKQSSQSTGESIAFNRAFDLLRSGGMSQFNRGTGAVNALSALLGVGGNQAAADRGFQNFLNSSGYKFQLGQGMDAINTNNAARGLLNSGSALKQINQFGQGLAGTSFQNYIANLSGLAQLGQGAGGLLASSGGFSRSMQQSTSKGKSSEGFGDIFGSIIGAVGAAFI